MPQKKHMPEEIVAKLRQVDMLVSQGQSVAEAVRTIGVTQFSPPSRTSTTPSPPCLRSVPRARGVWQRPSTGAFLRRPSPRH